LAVNKLITINQSLAFWNHFSRNQVLKGYRSRNYKETNPLQKIERKNKIFSLFRPKTPQNGPSEKKYGKLAVKISTLLFGFPRYPPAVKILIHLKIIPNHAKFHYESGQVVL
jgi:hypothetical protein